MKKRTVLMAGILAMHTMGASLAMANQGGLTERQQQLIQLMEEKGAKQAIRQMSNEELLAAREDLRTIITTLRADFAIAELQDGERLGYKVRTAGLYGVGAAGAIFILGIIDESVGFGSRVAGPDKGGSIMAGMIIGALVGTAAVATTTVGQAMVWLTPSEAAVVQDKLDLMVKALNQLDSRLK
ncbi:hypothetical protein AZI86_13745 [Bdellovibrio bacteriovorus]|uniref:Uncharacterized protein n=1 Tax=Bdellovibrio bacteriovorus TaxID=959 RepID=A0A150WJB2_BDEBC|nr:hypothetical protein [Bdellovibrio bacteriovorus]KYG63877.1 hypothetical protein AZI86_13745 [Bdellovibrio bacteriovorus]